MRDSKLRFAGEMRRNPTPAEAALWSRLRFSQCGTRFASQVPAYGYILDFYATEIGLAVEVDGPIHDTEADRYRDGVMGTYRIATLRFTNQEVLGDIEHVLELIRETVRQRRVELRQASTPENRRAAKQLRTAYKRQFRRP